jgi:Fe2+ transport system protein FeoA
VINKNLNIINEQKPLAYLKPGQKGQLAYIDGGEKMRRRLEVLGLRPGKEIWVKSAFFNKGPVIISLDGRLLAIGRGQAQKIYLEKVREG